MKTIIIYESTHHGNTKKLVDAISQRFGVETCSIENAKDIDLTQYDCIGIASGVAFGRFYADTEAFVKNCLPEKKKVFFLYTCGKETGTYTVSVARTAKARGCEVIGSYGCLGYDTFGPFKVIGGIAKGHPTGDEIAEAVKFFENHIGKCVIERQTGVCEDTMELIKNIKKDKNWNSGELMLPLTGTSIMVNIDFDVDMAYAQACAEHAVHLQDHPEITNCLYEKIISYCEMYRDLFDEEGIEIPADIEGSGIMKHITLEGLTICAPEGEGVAYTLYGDCEWEEEHGIEISICNNRVGYVGEYCAVNPWKE